MVAQSAGAVPEGGAAGPAAPDGGVEWEPEFVPILGQFFGVPDAADPVELPGGVDVDEPDEVLDVPLPDPAVLAVLLLVLGVLVAALATSAPPAMRPVVSAPAASTLRRESFMGWGPSFAIGSMSAPLWGTVAIMRSGPVERS